jgi:hypothetical protein
VSHSVKPVFEKAAAFKGTQADYNELVWAVTKQLGKSSTDGRVLNSLQIDQRDYKQAYDFLFTEPVFAKAPDFRGTDAEYNSLVWKAAKAFGKAATDSRTLNALKIDDRDYKRAYDFLFPRP